MTEKQKMLAGKPYLAFDFELTHDRKIAKRLCYKINSLKPGELKKRIKLFKKLFKTKNEVYVEPVFFCDYGYNITVGKKFYANHNCVILDCNKVTIGDNVMLGPGVHIYTASHSLDYKIRMDDEEFAFPVKIGNNVWIGGGAIICPGVSIGDNSVIGAGSVVTKDVPADVVAVGNPCRVIKKLKS